MTLKKIINPRSGETLFLIQEKNNHYYQVLASLDTALEQLSNNNTLSEYVPSSNTPSSFQELTPSLNNPLPSLSTKSKQLSLNLPELEDLDIDHNFWNKEFSKLNMPKLNQNKFPYKKTLSLIVITSIFYIIIYLLFNLILQWLLPI